MAITRRATDKDATWARAWTADVHDDLELINAITGPGGPRHGDVAYVVSEKEYYWWQDDGTWFNASEGSGGLFGVGQWVFSSQTIQPPTSHQVRFNTSFPPSTITKVWITSETDEGIDAHNILMAVTVGTKLYIQDKNDSSRWFRFVTSALPVDFITYVELPVVWEANGNALNNNQAIIVRAASSGSTSTVLSNNVTGFPPSPNESTDDGGSFFGSILAGIGLPYFKKGSVPFSDGASLIESNTKLHFDRANTRLGIGKIPGIGLDVLVPGVDIGYVASFRDDNNTATTIVLIDSAPISGGANSSAALELRNVHFPAAVWRILTTGQIPRLGALAFFNANTGLEARLNPRAEFFAMDNAHFNKLTSSPHQMMAIDGEDCQCDGIPFIGTSIIP